MNLVLGEISSLTIDQTLIKRSLSDLLSSRRMMFAMLSLSRFFSFQINVLIVEKMVSILERECSRFEKKKWMTHIIIKHKEYLMNENTDVQKDMKMPSHFT